MKLSSIGESPLLPQPPSFAKKKFYEVHGVLGRGTFGKVVVRRAVQFSLFIFLANSVYNIV